MSYTYVLGTSLLYRGLTAYVGGGGVGCVLYRSLLVDMVSHTYVLGTFPLYRGLTLYVEG